VLLVGGGGREHALAWKIAQSPLLDHLISAPGNPGIARHAECVGVKDSAIDDLVALAGRERADLVVVGPELPLSLGLADRLREAGFAVFGPSQAAARLESSKAFSKDLMARYGIPTARFETFRDAEAARRFCRELGAPLVVKTDGLAAGKGPSSVAPSTRRTPRSGFASRTRLRRGRAHGRGRGVHGRGGGVVLHRHRRTSALPFQAAQDHKTIFDGDRGPNTGGMARTPGARHGRHD
jgi:phosphoribosylamine--glycine ligase